jgi:neutral ceramidase
MGDTGVRRSIVDILSTKYPGLYTNENIALVSTHQHSGVGGCTCSMYELHHFYSWNRRFPVMENLLPQLTTLGYVNQTADAIVSGTVLAVERAHDSLAPGSLSLGNVTVLGANINRSPSAYLANPEEERRMYEYDQDKDLTLLRFDDASGNPRGFLSFFPVHGTSLYGVRILHLLIRDICSPAELPPRITLL